MGVCPKGPTIEGIDVSYYQKTIEWPRVKASGREFAYIRVTDGLQFTDPLFNQNWVGAKEAGVLRGAYQFFRPGQDAVAQADLFRNKVGALDALDLPPMLDLESMDGESGATVISGVMTWIDRIRSTMGVEPIIYTGSGFWNPLPSSNIEETTPLWVANWYVQCPNLPSGWRDWKFWQYSEVGQVPGIQGNVDLDRFNGSLADLKLYALQSKGLRLKPLIPIAATVAIVGAIGSAVGFLLAARYLQQRNESYAFSRGSSRRGSV